MNDRIQKICACLTRGGIAVELLKKANSEVASLQGRPRIGELAFDGEYGKIFRQILQGVDCPHGI